MVERLWCFVIGLIIGTSIMTWVIGYDHNSRIKQLEDQYAELSRSCEQR